MESENENKQNPEIKLDSKSKILFAVLALLIVGSVAATYWRYMVKRDYIVRAQIDCDPETENCLVWRCDPMSLEEGEKCTGNPDSDIWYYKVLNRNAKNIPDCPARSASPSDAGGDPNDENCAAYQCEPGELECEISNCDPAEVGEDEECSLPEQYLLENPPEEESVKCENPPAGGDEECLAEQEAAECDSEDEECEEATDEEESANVEEESGPANEDSGEINSGSQNVSPEAGSTNPTEDVQENI